MGRQLALLILLAIVAGAIVLRGTDVEPLAPPEAAASAPLQESRPSAELVAPAEAGRRSAPTPIEAPAPRIEADGASAPVLVGRLVLADGAAYADETPRLTITRGAGERFRSRTVPTDGEGRFTFPVGYVADSLVGLRLTVRERGRLPRPLTAHVDLPPLERGATTDVGDVLLRRQAIGVSCRLVDRARRPVVGAGELGPKVELWGPDGLVRHDDGRERGSSVVLQSDGDAESGWLALDPRGQSMFPKPWFVDPMQPGAERRAVGGRTGVAVRLGDEVELVVAHGGTIRGSVVQDEERGARVDRVRVRAMEDVGAVTWGRSEDEQVAYATIEEDGRFEVEAVDAGLRRVEFLSEQLLLFTVEDVGVRLEEVVDDPRLQGVDLGVITRAITLRVVDPEGTLVPGAVALVGRGGSYGEFTRTGDEVRVLLPVDATLGPTEPATSVVVHAPGFVPETLDPPFHGAVVVLEPALPIRARTAAPFESDVGSHGFWLRLRRVDAPEVGGLWAAELPFGWDGTERADLTVPGPGRYELEVMVKTRMGTFFGTTPRDRYVGTGVFLEVGQERAASPLVLDVPEDLVRFDT